MTPLPGPTAVRTIADVRVSVVICAYTEDRWDDVLAAVASVQAQRPAAAELIIVIDHNPTLLARLAERLPGLRIVANAGPRGLSGARNTGVALATGEVVAFLDDDAVAHPGWISGLARPYLDQDVLGVGGLTRPAWDTARPDWWPAEFDWVIGCTFVGTEPGPVRNLLGGNASFRRELFGLTGGFATHLGRTAADSRPLGCEETEFCIRAGQARPDGVFLHDTAPVIDHRVPATRATWAYFRSRCWSEGLSKAHMIESVGADDGLSTERSYVLATLSRGVLRGLRQGLAGDPTGLRRAGAIVAGLACTTAGYGYGLLRRRLAR
jgi:hypothetical protein